MVLPAIAAIAAEVIAAETAGAAAAGAATTATAEAAAVAGGAGAASGAGAAAGGSGGGAMFREMFNAGVGTLLDSIYFPSQPDVLPDSMPQPIEVGGDQQANAMRQAAPPPPLIEEPPVVIQAPSPSPPPMPSPPRVEWHDQNIGREVAPPQPQSTPEVSTGSQWAGDGPGSYDPNQQVSAERAAYQNQPPSQNSPPARHTPGHVTPSPSAPPTSANIAKEAAAAGDLSTGQLLDAVSGDGGSQGPPPPPMPSPFDGDDGPDFDSSGANANSDKAGEAAWDKLSGDGMKDAIYGMTAGVAHSFLPGDASIRKDPNKMFMDDASNEVTGEAASYGKRVLKDIHTFNLPDLMQVMAELPVAIADWSEELVASKENLVQFNGEIATAFMQSKRRDILRNIESGERTSGSTADLMGALDNLKDEVQPIKDEISNVLATTLTPIVQSMAAMVYMLREWHPGFKLLEEAAKKYTQQQRKEQLTPFTQFMKDVANKKPGSFTRPVKRKP